MKKLLFTVMLGTISSMMIVSAQLPLNAFDKTLSCTTLQEGKVNLSNFNSSFEYVNSDLFSSESLFIGLQIPQGSEKISLKCDDEGQNCTYNKGNLSLKTEIDDNGTVFLLNNKRVDQFPTYYNPTTNVVYFLNTKQENDKDWRSEKRTLSSCNIQNTQTIIKKDTNTKKNSVDTKKLSCESVSDTTGIDILHYRESDFNDGVCNSYTVGNFKVTCDKNGGEVLELNGLRIDYLPDYYDSKTDTVYYIQKDNGNFLIDACKVVTVSENNKKSVEGTTVVSKEKYKELKNMPLFQLVEHFGYNWKKDRKNIAQEFGIKNYKGTVKQNILIKRNLLKRLTIQ